MGIIDPKFLRNPLGIFSGKGPKIEPPLVKRMTPEQEREGAYVPGISELVYNEIWPASYAGHTEEIERVLHRVIQGKLPKPGEIKPNRQNDSTEREDAWRLYLGLPQANGTFLPSQYKPTKAKDPNAFYYTYKNFSAQDYPDYPNYLRQTVEEIKKQQNKSSMIKHVGNLGYAKVSMGQDEKGSYLSLYDKWDFDPKEILEENRLGGIATAVKAMMKFNTKVRVPGKSFEVYDRLYYDPKTYEPLSR